MRRRDFLWLAAGAFAAPAAPLSSTTELQSELRTLFTTPDHAVDVGRRYLAVYPVKADRATLIADLHGDWTLHEHQPLALRVARWQERDFCEGAIVVLDGWMLTRSEASICALLALG